MAKFLTLHLDTLIRIKHSLVKYGEGSAFVLLIFSGLLLFFSGCATVNVSDTVIGPDYVPSNVYTNPSPPMKAIRRVAVLPITTHNKDINSEYLRKTYQPIFMSELFKAKKFEVVEATPELLWELNNKKEWQAEEKLPSEFFIKLRDATGCEAVLFTRITVFKPYPPVSMGLNIKLVECESAKIIWSTDEVFDAGNSRVANSARRYYQNNLSIDKTGADSYVILRTPTQFARYVYYELFRRMPVWSGV